MKVADGSVSRSSPDGTRQYHSGAERPQEDSSGVYMASVHQSGKLGVACYDATTAEVQVLQAHEESAGPLAYQALQLAKLHFNPQIIYTSSMAEEAFLDALRQGTSCEGAAAEYEVRLEKGALFHAARAMQTLGALRVRGITLGLAGQAKMHMLHTMVNLSATQQVCAMGALLAVLHRDGLLRSVHGLTPPHSTGRSPQDDDFEMLEADNGEGTIGNCGGGFVLAVEAVSEVSLAGFLSVDVASLRALQIFQEERHPSAMGIGSSKEGFSAFGLLNRSVSPAGKRLLRLWFLRPIISLPVIRDRQDTIEVLMRTPDVLKSLQSILRRVKDVPRLLHRLQIRQSLLDVKDFAAILDSLAALLLLRDTLLAGELPPPNQAPCDATSEQAGAGESANNTTASSHTRQPSSGAVQYPAGAVTYGLRAPGQAPSPWSRGPTPWQQSNSSVRDGQDPPLRSGAVLGIVRKAATCIDDNLMTCHALIGDVIDTDQEEGMLVAAGVSDKLDSLKRTYAGLPDFLTHVVNAELARVPRHLNDALADQLWSIVYMPQVGFLVRVEGARLGPALAECLPDYKLAFEGAGEEDAATFYACNATRALHAKFGDMLHRIHDLEGSICSELLRRLAEFGPSLARGVALAAEVDCLAALALAAREGNYVRPLLTQANVLHIRQGRHMLAEMVTETFIPNDTYMHADTGRVQVITGPNFSGKSCYAKQVALIVFLAHIGSFVPAKQATIGVTDRIFTRVATTEALAVPQSAFMMDLSQVSAMLRHATSRSLCIIDEFGKGTLSTDGVGLLCASLRHFAAQQPAPPKVVACTHFSEAFNPLYLPRSRQLAFLTMDVLSEPGARNAASAGRPGRVVFLYSLVPGYAAPSFAVHCAQLAGVSADVLQRASQVIEARAQNCTITAKKSEAQQARDARNRGLVEQLLVTNLQDTKGVEALLANARQGCRKQQQEQPEPASNASRQSDIA